MKTSSRKTLTL